LRSYRVGKRQTATEPEECKASCRNSPKSSRAIVDSYGSRIEAVQFQIRGFSICDEVIVGRRKACESHRRCPLAIAAVRRSSACLGIEIDTPQAKQSGRREKSNNRCKIKKNLENYLKITKNDALLYGDLEPLALSH
jgi:hypothetical protein